MLARFGDLLLESEVALPTLPASEGPVECFVRVGRAGSARPGWDHHWRAPDGTIVLSCARDDREYRLGVPELATFDIDEDGAEVTCRAEGDLPDETLEHLLIDQVLPRVLAHRGRLVMHAGCVATPHGAIAFLGDSGAGKSTLCASFVRAGHALVGDDGIVALPNRDGDFAVVPTYPGLRLFAEPMTALFGAGSRATPVAHYSAKKRVAPQSAGFGSASERHPLRALYVLDAGPEIRIAPIDGADAFTAIVKASFQLHLDDPERSTELFERIGELTDAVPVRRATYPRTLALLPAVREALLADLSLLPGNAVRARTRDSNTIRRPAPNRER